MEKITEEERQRRFKNYNFARHSVRLEGCDIYPEMKEICMRYVNGEISNDECNKLLFDFLTQQEKLLEESSNV